MALDWYYEQTQCPGPVRKISEARAMAVDPKLKKAEGLESQPQSNVVPDGYRFTSLKDELDDLDVSDFPDDFWGPMAEDSKASSVSYSQSTSHTIATPSIVSTPSSSPIHHFELGAKSETRDEPPSKKVRNLNADKDIYLYSNSDMNMFIESFRRILNASKAVNLTVTGKGDQTPKESSCGIASPPPPPYYKSSMTQRDWLAFYPAARSIFAYYPAITVDIEKDVTDG
ncbi:hypothetical protein ACHAPA_009477 [Fusarium lateritium]